MGDILQDFREKIKGSLADRNLFISGVLVLVALASFGLGRQSTGEVAAEVVPIQAAVAADEPAASAASTPLPTTYYVASKNGETYHLPHCSGAKNIAEANKITFNSKAEAEAAGYRPAQNCKGI